MDFEVEWTFPFDELTALVTAVRAAGYSSVSAHAAPGFDGSRPTLAGPEDQLLRLRAEVNENLVVPGGERLLRPATFEQASSGVRPARQMPTEPMYATLYPIPSPSSPGSSPGPGPGPGPAKTPRPALARAEAQALAPPSAPAPGGPPRLRPGTSYSTSTRVRGGATRRSPRIPVRRRRPPAVRRAATTASARNARTASSSAPRTLNPVVVRRPFPSCGCAPPPFATPPLPPLRVPQQEHGCQRAPVVCRVVLLAAQHV